MTLDTGGQIPDLATLHARGAAQQPSWPDAAAVDTAVAKLRGVPPLVFAGECDDLRAKLSSVAAGEAFLLQGGDCAETFDGVTADNIQGKLRTLLSMAVVLTYAAQVPIVKVGRMAGQYAKPRSAAIETRGGVGLPAYRGDAVNAFAFTPEARRPDPQRRFAGLGEVFRHLHVAGQIGHAAGVDHAHHHALCRAREAGEVGLGARAPGAPAPPRRARRAAALRL